MHFDRLAGARRAPRVRMLASRPRLLAAGATLLIMSWTLTVSAAVCYVNGTASGANTGASWTDAYTDLQSALNNASCTEVWVAQGIYKPAASNTAVSFNIGPNVAVYGGFSGSETSRDARSPVAHATTLSGVISGGNSQHVVVMNGTAGPSITATTVLDGFTLTGGNNTNGKGGGALWCQGNGAGHACNPTLANLVFSGNHAGNGGAMALDGYSGGASNPTLTNIAFSNNSASTFGGAMYCNAQLTGGNCSPTLTNVTFSTNSSGTYGGAMFNDGSGSGNSSPILTNVTFSGNSAASSGGAIFNNGGGGTSSPTLTNVTFNGNSASYGGAMYNSGGTNGNSSPTLNNVILWGDTATTSGAELYHSASGSGSAVSFIYYGIIEGDCQINMSCSNTTASDPQLGTLGDNGGFTLTLMPGSAGSAVNTVPCYLTPLTDQRGAARPDPASAALPKRCDMGAVEAGSLAGDVIFIGTFGQAPRDE
jgi:predicted outer membrane repeat protein